MNESTTSRIFIEMQEKFFAERKKSLEWLQGLSTADWEITYTSEYGSVSAGEMFSCWIAHDNLHYTSTGGAETEFDRKNDTAIRHSICG